MRLEKPPEQLRSAPNLLLNRLGLNSTVWGEGGRVQPVVIKSLGEFQKVRAQRPEPSRSFIKESQRRRNAPKHKLPRDQEPLDH